MSDIALSETDLSIDLSERISDELSPNLLSETVTECMDRSSGAADDRASVSVKKAKKYISRRLSSVSHVPTTIPNVCKIDINSLTTSQLNELKSLIASFPDVPTEIITESYSNSNNYNSISSSAMKAVSSGWGAMRGFFNSNKEVE